MPTRADAALARWGRLTLKELRETLRDRRTILTLVFMPLLVYPLLGLVFQKFIIAQYTVAAPPEYHVAVATKEEGEHLQRLYKLGDDRLKQAAPDSGEPHPPNLQLVEGPAETPLEELVADGRADLGVKLRQRRSGRWVVTFIELQGSVPSRNAREMIEARFRAVNDAFVQDVFSRNTPPLRLPVSWNEVLLPGEPIAAFSLASIVPLILILMTVTGAVYPAIDLTAGERERGTLEALIAAPVPRYQILCAKYAAVLVVVLLTALANLTAMTATAFSTGLEQALFGREGLSVDLLVKLLGLLSVFAAFFAAVILTLTSIARSFKEAQAYLIPLMVMSLVPGVLALFPGLQMTALWAVTPLANIVLLARELFDHRVTPVLAVLTLVSTVGYAGLALAVAARVFGTDAVLYGSAATWSDLLRRPEEVRSAPDWTQGVLALAVLFPTFVLLSGVPARMEKWTVMDRLGANAVVLVVLFAAWPMALCWLRRIEWRGAFRIRRSAVMAIVGAAALGLSLWPFLYEIVRMISTERITALAEQFKSLKAELDAVPLAWKLLALAIVPALCEELFFRGFLLQSLVATAGPWASIGISATVFGLFHVLVGDALVAERFLPTMLMGLILGWVCWCTGSILPGMVLHVIHNSTLLTVGKWFPALNPEANEVQTSLGWPVLSVAAAVAMAGLALVHAGRRTS